MLKLSPQELRRRASQLRWLVLDVDGVLTRGDLTYIGAEQELRGFHTHDGLGVMMARSFGIKVAFITGKNTLSVARRAKELGIDETLQGFFSKEEGLKELVRRHQVLPDQMAYVGDDLHDIPALKLVSLPLSVANARESVKEQCVHVSKIHGGDGAVRELVEWLLGLRGEREEAEELFSLTSREKESKQINEPLVVTFSAQDPLALLARCPAKVKILTAKSNAVLPYNLRRLQSLESYTSTTFGNEANILLSRLNGLADGEGELYKTRVNVEGYHTWWFQQEAALKLLQAYCRFSPLLQAISEVPVVTLIDCPGDLATVLRLYPFPQTRLVFRSSHPVWRENFLEGITNRLLRVFKMTIGTVWLVKGRLWHPQVLLFSSDVVTPGKTYDGRIEKVYRALAVKRIRYLEIFGSQTRSSVVSNFIKRRRLALYRVVAPTWLQAGGLFHRIHNQRRAPISADTPEETFLHSLAERVLVPASARSACIVRDFSQILRIVKPKNAILLDDSRYAHELVVACRLNRVPSLGIQHGLYCCIAPGFLVPRFDERHSYGFDRYLVWSPFFVDYMSKVSPFFTRDHLVIGGLPRDRTTQSRSHPMTGTSSTRGTRVVFLMEAYDDQLQEAQVLPYVQALLRDARVKLSIKLRPGQKSIPFRGLGAPEFQGFDLLEGSIEEAFSQADVVVGSWSTATLDAIYSRLPLVLFRTALYDDPLGLSVRGLAIRVEAPEDIGDAITRASRVTSETLEQAKQVVWGSQEIDAEDVIREEALLVAEPRG